MSEKFKTQPRSAINAYNISKYLKDSGVIPSLAVAYGNEFPDTESLPIGYRFTLKDSIIEVDDGIYIWSGYSWVQELAL